MPTYFARGRTVATGAAGANEGVAVLWNPHSTARLTVYQAGFCFNAAPGGDATLGWMRVSARGTAGSTVTPGVQHALNRGIDPPSGALLDLANYSVEPTVDGGPLQALRQIVRSGAGLVYQFPRGHTVPPGEGLGLIAVPAVIIDAADVWFYWGE